MRSEEDCIKYASECWEKGFNCAETAMRGICYAHEIELPEVALKMATPFGGGIGRSEDACGAMTGGVLGIGAVLGRTEAKGNKTRAYEAARELKTLFERRFNSTQCKILNEGDFVSPVHERRCKEFTLESVRITYRILKEE
ncbi:MAG: C-GCAxxG-C-C family protein [Methanomassiliicoccales archaeon]|nr:C-GCAxxG-C-C family protein [Methanomassiliicoccales archaeon]